MDLWTSPSGRPAPSGACGQAVDDARASPTALSTLAGLSPTIPQDSNNNPFIFWILGREADGKKALDRRGAHKGAHEALCVQPRRDWSHGEG